MARARSARGRQRIGAISGPPKVAIYRAAFRPFESTKYLDRRALARTRKATVELGTLEVPGCRVPIAAEIRRGMITALRPIGSLGCPGGRKQSQAGLRRILGEVTRRVEASGVSYLKLPVPLALSPRTGASLTIGPVVIVIDEAAPCIWIWVGWRYCLICTFGWTCG